MDKKIIKKLKNIKAAVFDADGVLFTGSVFVHPEKGEVLKERSHVDGHGISLLRDSGIVVAFVTAEKTNFLTMVCNKWNSQHGAENRSKVGCFVGFKGQGKVRALDGWLAEKNISWQECAAMGDDLTDYAMLKKAAFAAVPRQAEKKIKDIADYVSEREGGRGAIRDFCNLILEAKKLSKNYQS